MGILWCKPAAYKAGWEMPISATSQDIESIWGEFPEATITIPITQRLQTAEVIKAGAPEVWIVVRINGRTGGIELQENKNGTISAWLWYEDSPENWDGDESERTAWEGTYDPETGKVEFT